MDDIGMHAKPMRSQTDTANGISRICISRIHTTFWEKLPFLRINFALST